MGGSNPCKRCMCAGQDCLVHPSRWVIFYYTYYYFLIISFFIADLLYVPGASLSSSSVYPTPTPTPQLWSPLMVGSWVPLKKHSGSLWRSTKELGSPSGTWWRARRGIRPNWRELGLWWSRDEAQKERVGRRRMEMIRRGPMIALEKVRRRGLHRPPFVSIVVLFSNRIFIFIYFLWNKCMSKKSKNWNEKKFEKKPRKVHRSWGLMKISEQNILRN